MNNKYTSYVAQLSNGAADELYEAIAEAYRLMNAMFSESLYDVLPLWSELDEMFEALLAHGEDVD